MGKLLFPFVCSIFFGVIIGVKVVPFPYLTANKVASIAA